MPPKFCFVYSGPSLPPLYSMTQFVITSRSLWPVEVSEELCLRKDTLSCSIHTAKRAYVTKFSCRSEHENIQTKIPAASTVS